MMKLLLIEDDREIALALRQVLQHNYAVTLSDNGTTALEYAENETFDLIILDLHLPDLPGLKVCEKLRAMGYASPILILTAEVTVLNKIRLLDAGADDYLTKPFSVGELKARLRVLERRERTTAALGQRLSVGGLTLDTGKYRAEREGHIIHLRRKEFALLECMMQHAGTVVSRSVLGNYAWRDSDRPWTNTIDVHIKHLRDKVDRPFERQLIRTVHGLGYKIEIQEPARTGER